MIGTDLVRAVLTVGLIGAYLLDSLELAIGIVALRTSFTGLFIPARTGLRAWAIGRIGSSRLRGQVVGAVPRRSRRARPGSAS